MDIELFLGELAVLNQKLGRDDNSLSPETRDAGLRKQLFEYQRMEAQIKQDIEREIEDYLDWVHRKKAGIEALTGMSEYVCQEISRLEKLIQGQKESVA